jgi:triacylglycerol lipase
MTTLSTIDAIRRLGREILPAVPGSQAVYAGQHETEPYEGVQVVRDVSYGPHARHRLDVFEGQDGLRGKPVFIFVHGGGFVGGDKRIPGSPYNDNVALWAVRNGMVGINITYRLAPEFGFPSGSEDLAAAVAWARANAPEFGGDPDQIYILGTSAGAVHVANFVAHRPFDAARAGVKGVILLSGVYDLEATAPDGMNKAYYGEDVSRYGRMSALPGLVESPIPILFVLTEFDPEMFERQALRTIEAWVARHGHWPDFVRLMGHNHLTSTFHLNTKDDYLGTQILAFMARAG